MNLLLLPQGYLLDGICTKSFISTNHDHKEQLMDYIEREAALAQTHEINIAEVGYRHRCIDPQAIKEIPAADVVPVVRCKDCLAYISEDGFCSVHADHMPKDGFCSFGSKEQ